MKKQTKQEAELLRLKAEGLLKKRTLKSTSQHTETEIHKLVHELEVHQIELEMQNDELRLSKEQTEASVEKYTELYDFAPLGYFTLSENGVILEANIIGSQMLGVDRSYLINKSFGIFVSNGTRPIFNLFLKNLFKSKSKESCEILLVANNNQLINIFLSGIVAVGDGKCLLTAIDISELKKVQIELLESEERLKVASMATGFGTYSFYFDSGEAHYSEGLLNLYGLRLDETLELDTNLVAKALHPDDKNRFLVAMQEANNPCGSGILDIEFRIIHKDGKIRWLRSRGLTVFTGNKPSDRPIHANGIVQDITVQKNAELELEMQNIALKKLNLFSIKLSSLSDKDTLEVIIAQQLKEIAGAEFAVFSEFDPINRSITVKCIEVEANLLKKGVKLLGKQVQKIQSVLTDEMYNEITTDIIGERKTLHEISFGAIPVTVGEAIQKMLKVDRFIGLGYLMDGKLYGTSVLGMKKGQPDPKKEILENFVSIASVSLRRNKADKVLRESEEKWHSLFDILPVGVSIVDSENQVKDFNSALSQILDLSNEGLLKGSYSARQYLKGDYTLMSPDEFPSIRALKESRIIKDVEIGIKKEDGSIIWTNVSAAPLSNLNSTVTITTDITERKLADEKLRTSEERLRVGLNSSNIAVFNQDKNLRYIWIYRPQLGYTLEQVVGHTDNELLPPKVAKQVTEIKQRVLNTGLKENAEVIVNVGNQRFFYNLLAEPLRDKDGIIIGLTGSTLDITESKKVEEELRSSEEKWRSLVSNSPDYIALHDKEGRYLFLNRYAEGFSEKDIVGKVAFDFISNESKYGYKSAFEKCVQTHTKQEIEYKALGGNSEMKFYESTFVPIKGSENEINVLVVAKDITERKKAENVLNDLIDKNPISIQIMDKDGYTLKVNASHTSLFGTLPPSNFSIFEDLNSKGYGDYILRAQKGEVVHFPDIYYNVHDVFPDLPDKPKWIRAVLFPLTDPRGITERFVFMHEDITSQKEAEDTLRKNNSRLELAMQIANMSWWEMDVKTGNVSFNKRKAEMLGYPPEQFKHYTDFMALVHPDDYDNCMNAMWNHLKGQASSYEAMYRMKSKSGFYKWFLDIGSIVERDSNGAPLAVTGIVIDVNNRKLTEEALHKAMDFLDKIINTVASPIFVKNEKSEYFLVNKAFSKFLNLPAEKLIGKTGYDFFPKEQFDQFIANDKEVLETGIESVNEQRITDGEGLVKTAITKKSLYTDIDGKKFLVGIINDITERKQIEDAVHEAFQFNKQIIEGAQEGVVVYDKKMRYQLWNPFMERLTGIAASEILGKIPFDIFPFLKTNGVVENINNALNGESTVAVDFPFTIDSTGKTGWASDIAAPLYNFKGEIIGAISTVRDITQKKKIEQELFESLKLFYTLFNSSPNAIALIKMSDESFVRVNNRFLELVGYELEEVKGRSSLEIGLIQDSAMHEKRLNIIQKNGKIKDFEVDIYTKLGDVRHCLVSAETFTLDHEEYILNNFVDFTDRKKIENENKEIKEALENLNRHLVEIRENERASIAREIHDQLGQSLTALKIDLKWLHDKKLSDSELSQKLKGMIDLTSETIKDVQRITSELRPSILDDIGLSAALEWYCIEFSKRTGLQLHMDINDVQTEDVQKNLSIYRILQESLTNVIRHSGAKNVIVSLSIIEKNLVLLIQDDGAGITQTQVNSMKSFGIMGMIERVKQSGGLMEITSLDNGGTLVSVHIPLK